MKPGYIDNPILADVYARLAHIDGLRKTALAAEEARLERARSQV